MADFFYEAEKAKAGQVIVKPEHLAPFIDLATELEAMYEHGARWAINDLSEGQWACVLGRAEGVNRARNEQQAAS